MIRTVLQENLPKNVREVLKISARFVVVIIMTRTSLSGFANPGGNREEAKERKKKSR